MKLYREVKCSDRLPEEGIYHTIGTTNKDGSRVLESLMFVNGEFEDGYYEVDLWLEVFEINEDDILDIVDKTTKSNNLAIQTADDIMNLLQGK